MEKRFQIYLDKKFSKLPKTKDVKDFREELLGNLLDKAKEYEDKGLSEQEIYEQCIDSLGDYSESLRQLYKGKIIDILKSDIQKYLLYIASYFLFTIIVYLGISLITKGWSWSWLIVVASTGIFLAVIIGISYQRAYALKKIGSSQLLVHTITFCSVGVVYFGLSFAFSFNKTWVIWVFLPAIMITVNTLFAKFKFNRKISLPMILIDIIFISIGLYLLISVLFGGYHIWWLLILFAIFVDLLILIYNNTTKSKS